MDLHLLKACQTLTIQAVTEHRTASTDRRCKYLNGYVTVQHCSFGKPSFLDPWSSILASRNRRQSYFSPYMCLFNCHRQNKIIYANVYRNTINDSESQASPLRLFPEGGGASTDRRCKYLNGYVTVQHCSFGKPSFLDPWSLIIETRSSHLETRSVRASRCEDWVLFFELWVSTYFWALLLSSVKKWKMMWSTCHEHGTKKNLCPPQELNLWPSLHWSDALTATKDSWRAGP